MVRGGESAARRRRREAAGPAARRRRAKPAEASSWMRSVCTCECARWRASAEQRICGRRGVWKKPVDEGAIERGEAGG